MVVPWRGGCPHRERSLGWVTERWKLEGFEVVVGEHAEGAWCKAAAVADALARTDADTLIVADADVWPHGGVSEALGHLDGHGWTIPHRYVWRLSEAGSWAYMGGAELGSCSFAADRGQDRKPHMGTAGGGIVILTRQSYESCPLDPRFRGWGQEDLSWAMALKTIHGTPWRGTDPLVHLWHPPQERQNRMVGNAANFALHDRYRRAAGKPDRMAELLEEAR